MSDGTKIEWTEATWNPIRALNLGTGGIGHFCVHKSPGCKNCYAEGFQPRFNNPIRFAAQDRDKVQIFLDEKVLSQPLKWRKPRMIFVCSMTDLFGEFVTDEMLDRIFAVMALCPQHTFQCLTKRSDRMREYLSANDAATQIGMQVIDINGGLPDHVVSAIKGRSFFPLKNVWAGVSVEDQQRAEERIPDLLATPAAVRWLSCEPLLGPVDLRNIPMPDDPRAQCSEIYLDALTGYHRGTVGAGDIDGRSSLPPVLEPLDWVVVGGESGRGARGSTDEVEEWMRSLRDQCSLTGAKFFGKQNYRKLRLPDDLLVREYPVAQVAQ